MRSKIAPRIPTALHVLDVQPGDRVLEVGPGPGVAAELIAEKLNDGFLLAVDRSATAVERTRARTAAHVAAGKVEVRHTSVEQLDINERFDKIFAVNVNLFWVADATAHLSKPSVICPRVQAEEPISNAEMSTCSFGITPASFRSPEARDG
ncbi:MAG: class I SAM-dependent methyltransferase [Actinomycetota bacterium]|nr:class I SAM-dependent methyltransferase [Actinomycetota bacterium]